MEARRVFAQSDSKLGRLALADESTESNHALSTRLIALAFLALLLLRVVILLIMRSGERRPPSRNAPPPTVIEFDKPQGQHHDHA